MANVAFVQDWKTDRSVPGRAPRVAVVRLVLTDFRSYAAATLETDGRPVALIGENGAGKTNLLEALSLLGPGRGLRGAALAEMPRRGVDDAPQVSPWAVAARLATPAGPIDLGTGVAPEGTERRIARLDGTTVGLTRLAERLRMVWLTPAMDRLFVESAGGRRRFLDRLALALEPSHAAHSSAFEKAMRERNRLLREGPRDPDWLCGLEAEMARYGTAIAAARVRTVAALAGVIEGRGPFPRADIALEGSLEHDLALGTADVDVAARYVATLARGRGRDEAAGRTLAGPHATELHVTHALTGRPAAQCSTGEQKALLIGLILAQARLVARIAPEAGPILLLDEIAAHLDAQRREALFDALIDLGVQAWLTGTDGGTFAPLGVRAQTFAVTAGRLSPL